MPTVEANGIQLAYERFGAGKPLVLITGLATQMIYWPDEFCEGLAERGYEVIRFDNRDCGLSSSFSHVGKAQLVQAFIRRALGVPVFAPYTLEDMAVDTVQLLDRLGIDKAHMMGLSMGAMVAQTVAIRSPGRVRSLISMSSSPGPLRYLISKPRALRVLLRPAPEDPGNYPDYFVGLLRAVGSPRYPFDESWVRDMAWRSANRAYDRRASDRQLVAILASGSRLTALRRIQTPTLVIHGADDLLAPPSGGLATHRAIPGAKLLLIKGLGHDLPRGLWTQIIDAVHEHCRHATS